MIENQLLIVLSTFIVSQNDWVWTLYELKDRKRLYINKYNEIFVCLFQSQSIVLSLIIYVNLWWLFFWISIEAMSNSMWITSSWYYWDEDISRLCCLLQITLLYSIWVFLQLFLELQLHIFCQIDIHLQ
jgi:hypothetical protein